MTLPISNKLSPLIAQVAIRLVTLWEIERADGIIRYFTNADRQIEFEGNLYDPDDSVNSSAALRSEGLKPHNKSINGTISNESFTLNELQSGIITGSKVIERIVDRKFPWAGAVISKTYYVSSISTTESNWTAELDSLTSRLNNFAGSVFGRICRFSLGDSKCGVDLNKFTSHVMQVSSVSTPNNTRTMFMASDAIYVNATGTDFAEFGFINWLSGRNAGRKSEVFSQSISSNDITFNLLDHTPYDIDLTDLFTVTAGCNRTLSACRDKFDNLKRHGGFPFMPGVDKASQTADIK